MVTEIPYQTSVEAIEEKTADLVDKKEIDGIRTIRNESAKGQTRLVFELKKDAPALVILNQLYRGTPLQNSFSINMVALDDGVPRTMTLRDALECWVEHQINIVTRRTQYRLDRAQHELHINEGLLKAIGLIDEVIAAIRSSEDRAAARRLLMGEPLDFIEVQTNHILDMQLGRLTRLGREQIEEKVDDLAELITELEKILSDEREVRDLIIEELSSIREEFANDRRTELAVDPGEFVIEDLIDDEDLVVTLTAGGYVKTVSTDEFKRQGRGGRGVAGASLKDEDIVTTILHTSAHAYLLFFTNFGKVYRLKAHQIPTMSRTARGTAIVNLLQLDGEEKVAAVIDTRDYETNHFLVFATKSGHVKKTKFTEYNKSRPSGLKAINLKAGDELVRVIPTNGSDDVSLMSSNGKLMRFHEEEVRAMGRSAAGVRGMKLKEGDAVVAVSIAREAASLLIVTEKGYGKRTEMDNFNPKHRNGQGVTAIKISEERGKVVGSRAVGEDDEVFMIASNGVIIRMEVNTISIQGPYATGVKIMSVEEDEYVAAIAPVLQVEDEEE